MSNNNLPDTQDIINKQKLDIKKLAQMVKDTQTRYQEEITNIKEELTKRDEEIKDLKEKLKSSEKSNNHIFKNLAKGNVSELTDLQKQYEKEILVNKELIKTYSNTIKEKNQEISKFSEEVIYLRGLNEEEKKKSEFYLMNIKHKLELKSQDVEIYKLMTENSSLKTKLINLEENLEKKSEIIEKLNEEITSSAKNLIDNIDSLKIDLTLKEKSYTILIKDYHSTAGILHNIQEDLEKCRFMNKKADSDLEEMKFKYNNTEKEVIELKIENENLKTKIKGKECEVDILHRKLKDTESMALEYKLSKQIFNVRYNYLKMYMDGMIIMKKEDNYFYFLIENKTSTRTFTFLDVDLRRDFNDPLKFFVRFLKENKEEEYYYNDVNKIFDFFEDFRRKTIENSEIYQENESKIVETKQNNENKKKVVVHKKINNLFEF